MKRDTFLVTVIKITVFILLIPYLLFILILRDITKTIADAIEYLEEISLEGMLPKIIDTIEKLNSQNIPEEQQNDN